MKNQWTTLACSALLACLSAWTLAADLPVPAASELPANAREAVAHLQEALKDVSLTEADRGEKLGQLGMLYQASEQLSAAAAYYREAFAHAPDDARWYYLYGVAQTALGELDSAYAALRISFDKKPDYLPTLMRLAQLSMARGDTAEAERIATTLVKEKGFEAAAEEILGQLALQQGKTEESIRYFQDAIKRQPFANRLYYALAQALKKAGQADKAREALERRGEVAPVYPDPLMQYVRALVPTPERQLEQGIALAKNGDADGARSALKKGLELDPSHTGLLVALAQVEMEQGNMQAAKELLIRALKVDSKFLPAVVKMAEWHDAQGQLGKARSWYAKAIQMQPDNADVLAAWAALEMRQGDLAVAGQRFAEVARLRPTAVSARFLAALAWLGAGQCKPALGQLEEVRKLSPSDGRSALALALAWVTCDTDSVDKALALAQQVYDAAPGLESARVMAWLEAKRGQFGDAVDFQTQAMFEALKTRSMGKHPNLARDMADYRSGKLPAWDWQQYAREWAPAPSY
jgi:tetratricopeptide (TPR) repeat protein